MSTDTDMSVRGRSDKGKEKVFEDVIGPLIAGYESSSSDSLDSELGIPSVMTPGAR